MTRIAELDIDSMSEEQAEVYAAIASSPRGGVRGPLAVWLHRPGLADRAQALGQYCRYGSSLPVRLSELAIVVTGYIWQSAYEWDAHVPLALQAGISAEAIEALRDGKAPSFQQDDERIVYEFIISLHRNRQISKELYSKAELTLGKDAIVDLVGVAGYYTLISMTINAFDIASKNPANPFLLRDTHNG